MSNDGDKGSNSGGRTDAGPNRTTAYKAGVGNINEKGKKTGTYKSDNPDAFRNRGATKIKKGIKGPPSVQIVGNILSILVVSVITPFSNGTFKSNLSNIFF